MAHLLSVEQRVAVPATSARETWEIAATVHLPAPGSFAIPVPVLVVMPGAGYNRRYYDLPVSGYSEAEHHVGHGTVVIALDHLGTGDSSIPAMDVSTLETVAAANHAAVGSILRALREGSLTPGIGPTATAGIVGAGHSMGGFILAAMQAWHRTFDGVAVLGASMCSSPKPYAAMPRRPEQPELDIPAGTPPDEAAALVIAATDWRYVFFWEDVPEALVEADVVGGYPLRETAPTWGSLHTPGLATSLVRPGVMEPLTARIRVPVLLARGERDVCLSSLAEMGAFPAAVDLATFTAPRMAHLHNLAGTRQLIWDRLDTFVSQVCRVQSASLCRRLV